MIDWPRTVHRTHRDADAVARACPVERYDVPRLRWLSRALVGLALFGAAALLVATVMRSTGEPL